MATVKNICTGPRGVYLDGVMKMVEPGHIAESDDDFEPEWFEEVEEVEGEDDGEGLAAHTVAELKAIAEAEEIDLGDASKKADIISAIELAREAAKE